MKLHELTAIKAKSQKRIGRGYGSGVGGHTVGRGTKGQRSRVGKGIPLWFEGGQLPLTKKMPYLRGKLRFESLKVKPQLVRIASLEKLTEKEITPELLREKRLIANPKMPVKIVGVGALSRAIQCHGMNASASAKAQITKAGGTLD